MKTLPSAEMVRQLAQSAARLQELRTGHAPQAVAVVLSDDTLVFTMQEALTPAEKAMALTPDGAARVQEFHRRLFADSSDEMRREILRLTGRTVREAAAEIETTSGTVVHAFTTGAMVQVFLLAPGDSSEPSPTASDRRDLDRAQGEGQRIPTDESPPMNP